MASNSEFFKGVKPQAVLKHGVLGRYAGYFPTVAGSQARKGVMLIDAYAGAGRYDDDSLGSPLFLLDGAERPNAGGSHVKLVFIEADPVYEARLRRSVEEREAKGGLPSDVTILGQRFEEALPNLKPLMAERAVFLFADPFGLSIPRDQLLEILSMGGKGQPVDVLYHFSLSTVGRMAAAALSPATEPTGRLSNREQLDVALGIDWQSIFEQYYEKGVDGTATEGAEQIGLQFSESVSSEAGMAATSIQIRRGPKQLPIYSLVLFSGSPKAHWDFADQAGKAYVDWLLHCEQADWHAWKARIDAERELQQALFEPDDKPRPEMAEVEDLVAESEIPKLTGHLRELIANCRVIVPQNDVTSFYGSSLGRARSTHAKTVLKQLYAERTVDDTGVGDFWKREIRYTG